MKIMNVGQMLGRGGLEGKKTKKTIYFTFLNYVRKSADAFFGLRSVIRNFKMNFNHHSINDYGLMLS